jgi:hypothetical protein
MALSSRNKQNYDASSAVLLRSTSAAAVTATGADTAVAIDILQTAYWQGDNEIADGIFKVVFDVSAITTSGDATYTLTLILDDAANVSDSPVTVWTLVVKKAGVYVALLDSATLNLVMGSNANAGAWLASKVTIGGTTGKSITYACWLERAIGLV